MKNTAIIEFKHLEKKFGGVTAVDDVSFNIEKGDIHAIVGENGAGKSTLMKLISGIYQLDKGKIIINGREETITSPSVSEKLGISMVFQEFNLFSTLTIAGNIFFRHEDTASLGLLDDQTMFQKSKEILQELSVDYDPKLRVEELSLGQKQIVEIARAINHGTKIIIMDEPNSALNKYETDILFELIRKLKNKGITILYISHRLEEVFAISDKITVMRDGKYIGTWETSRTTREKIVSSVVGRKIDSVFPTRKKLEVFAKEIIRVEDISSECITGPFSFSVKEGEVLGFAGLEGSGVQDVFLGLFGLVKINIGKLIYSGGKIKKLISYKLPSLGVGMIPANRREEGLMLHWPIFKNITFNVLDKFMDKLNFIDKKNEADFSDQSVSTFNIATDSISKDANNLSGGNQQKVVLARWLAANPELLLLNDPTRGIDVGSKHEIYKMIAKWSKEKKAIIFTSSEIEEIIGLSDRIIVLYRGRKVAEFDSTNCNKEEIMKYVLGGESNNETRK